MVSRRGILLTCYPPFFSSYHPFYITDSKEGGFSQKTRREQKMEQVFAGVEYTKMDTPKPTAGTVFFKMRNGRHWLKKLLSMITRIP